MKVSVLSDNLPGQESGCAGEWGLSFFIETGEYRILLDAGAGPLFAENAKKLGIDLGTTDFAVLSHAHYDHAGGFPRFFEINKKANLYLAENADENCYKMVRVRHKYIGIPRGMLAANAGRTVFCKGIVRLSDNIVLFPHNTSGLEKTGIKNRMDLKTGRRYRPDDFCHEQTLAVVSGGGVVLFSSCSHSGPGVILHEAAQVFPGLPVIAYFGGLHLFERSRDEVRAAAEAFRSAGTTMIFTGHCTGDRAMEWLKEEPELAVTQIHTGFRTVL